MQDYGELRLGLGLGDRKIEANVKIPKRFVTSEACRSMEICVPLFIN